MAKLFASEQGVGEMDEITKRATEILRRPYGRLVTPDETGVFSAQIVEFPGCFACGDTAAEALSSLEETAQSWVEAALDQGSQIPEPRSAPEASGRFALRMPKSLHARAATYAELDGVSLNQFIVTALAEHLGGKPAKLESEHKVATAPSSHEQSITNGLVIRRFARYEFDPLNSSGYARNGLVQVVVDLAKSSGLVKEHHWSGKPQFRWIAPSPQVSDAEPSLTIARNPRGSVR